MFKLSQTQSDSNIRTVTWQKFMRLFLYTVAPAVLWIALAGLLGAYRLDRPDERAYTFMATPVAGLLLLSAFALIAAAFWAKRPRLWALLGTILVLVANYGEHVGLWWPGERDDFLRVATAMVLLSTILVFLQRRPPSEPGWVATNAQGILVCFVGSLISVAGAYALVERDTKQVNLYVQARAVMVSDALELSFVQPVGTVQRMVDRWGVLDHAPAESFMRQEFRAYIRDLPEIARISVINEQGRMLRDIHQGTQTDQLLENAQKTEAFEHFLQTVQNTNMARMSAPGMVQSQPHIVFVAAPFKAPIGGYVVATVDLASLVRQAFINDEPPCCFSIRSGKVEVYRTPVASDEHPVAVAQNIGRFEGMFDFKVTFWKENLPGEVGMAFYPLWVLLVGLAFTFFAALSQRMAQLAQSRAMALHKHSRHDPLTDLPNRRMFKETLDVSFEALGQIDGARLSLMFIEMRGLRLINDSLGHEMGDQLIKALAERLRSALPDSALLARLDSAEFVVSFSGLDDEQLTALARFIVDVMSAPIEVQARELTLTAVIGMSSSNQEMRDPMDLVRHADLAMLQAKRQVSTPWAHYTEAMGLQAALRMALSQDLKRAIRDGELNMVYQPLVDARTGQIVSMEALVRWQHHVHGFISPAQFIPMAEESGQILELTTWTLERACTDAQLMGLFDLPRTVPFAVNISPLCFQREDFIEHTTAVLERTGVPASYVQVEVTEGLMLGDQADTIRKLRALADAGILASLDDFGTGYSSLSLLKDLPIHKVKLDRSFVVHVTENEHDAQIVRGVVAISHQLSMTVVVEGVETAEQASLLAQLGCDQFQGYLFSKPVAPSVMQGLLREPPDYLALFKETDKT